MIKFEWSFGFGMGTEDFQINGRVIRDTPGIHPLFVMVQLIHKGTFIIKRSNLLARVASPTLLFRQVGSGLFMGISTKLCCSRRFVMKPVIEST